MKLATWCCAATLFGLLQSCTVIGNQMDRTASAPDNVARACATERRAATVCKMSDCAEPLRALEACEARAAAPGYGAAGLAADVGLVGAVLDLAQATPTRTPRRGDYMQCPENTVSACSASRGCECAPRRLSKE
ncbi:MAG: hypothetical protein QM639_11715 [Rhodocyclaceae bacterium]